MPDYCKKDTGVKEILCATICNNETIDFVADNFDSIKDGKLQYFNNIGTENPNLGQVQFDTDYVKLGYMYLMSDLKKPCWAFGRYQYCEADGVKARTPRSGTFANKPTVSNNFIYTGFAYFCIDRQTSEGSTNGIMIYHKGNDVWVDALGRVVV